MRKFIDAKASRETVPVWLALVGASGSGKTFSALRVATGISSVAGGDIFCLDTEGRRALHYADQFAFRHIPFSEPFASLDYLDACRHCVSKGAKVIIIDSASHEHEGEGGYLRLQESEFKRMGENETSRMRSWIRPAAERRAMLNGLLQLNVHIVWCFRAKEKVGMRSKDGSRKTEVVNLGWMPIAGESIVYEMTASCLLLPRSGGVPTWSSDAPGELATMKLPTQFYDLLNDGLPLSEDHGKKLALWASGKPAPTRASNAVVPAEHQEAAVLIHKAAKGGSAPLKEAWSKLTRYEKRALKPYLDAVCKPLAEKAA